MLLEVNGDQWDSYLQYRKANQLFTNQHFLKSTALSFKVDLRFYVWKDDNDREIMCFSIFCNNRVLKAPTNFHSFLVIGIKGNDQEIENAFSQSIRVLVKEFKSITLKLEPGFPYLNVFEELGFNTVSRHTYEKKLSNLVYSRNIQRTIKKGILGKYMVSTTKNFEASFSKIWLDNSPYLFTNKQKKYFNFLHSLFQTGFADVFDVHQGDSYIASLLTIKDMVQKKIFTYLISSPDKSKYAEAQTMLYDYCMNYYKAEGYFVCDLCGANLPSVSHYKSKFKGDLISYSIVTHSFGFVHKVLFFVKKNAFNVMLSLKNMGKHA